jgi:hypothetical protein
MADTTYLRYTVEPHVRDHLAEQHSTQFQPKTLTLKGGGKHDFDAVSDDGSIVIGIKACSLSNGKLKAGQTKNAISELWFLSLVDAPRRTLILTNRPFYEAFIKTLKGRLHPDITVECVELPTDMQARVDEIIADASSEVTPGGRDEIVKDAVAEELT